MNALRIVILAITTLLSPLVFSAEHLFSRGAEVSNKTGMALSPNMPLKALYQDPATQQVAILNVNAALLTIATDSITLPLEKNLEVVAYKYQGGQQNNGILVWHGRLPDARKNKRGATEVPLDEMNTVIVARHGDNITGSIRYRGQMYQIIPLGAGQHVMVKIDESKLPGDADGVGSDEAAQPPLSVPAQTPLSNVRVLLVVTLEAQAAWADLDGLAALMFAEANQGMANSGVPVHFESAGIYTVNYSDINGTDGYTAMLRDLRTPTQSTLGAPVYLMREQTRADLVVMLSKASGYCGLAYVNVPKAHAFSIVSCPIGNYTFAHEMGHNFGLSHDSDVSGGPYGDGFGYQQKKQGPYWRTIMSYDCSPTCPRVNYWSDPGRTYNGLPMGIAGIHNSIRVFNLRRDVIAGFYPPLDENPPVGQLDTPPAVDAEQTFVARVITPEAPADELKYRWNTPDFLPADGTTASLTLKAPAVAQDSQKTLSVEVANAYESITLAKTITIRAPGPAPKDECVTPWESSKTYSTIDEKVSYDGYNYESAFWSHNKQPDQHFVEEGSAQPWRRLASCFY